MLQHRPVTALPAVSVVIACRTVDHLTHECLERCLRQQEVSAEIIVLPDDAPAANPFGGRVTIVPTGVANSSVKRNRGLALARGQIIAFIDSDAFPDDRWLVNACHHLQPPDVGCVGGPNVNPPADGYLQQASGDVYATYLAAGPFSIRFRVTGPRDVPELPSCNLVVKRELLERIGGFDEAVHFGEDAKLCFQITALGRRIVYRPDVLVFHHRRPLFLPHARQVWRWARDKAQLYTMRPGPGKWSYWLPTLLVAGLLVAVAGLGVRSTRVPASLLLLSYGATCAAAGLLRSVRRGPVIAMGIVLTHWAYGLGFVAGLLRKAR